MEPERSSPASAGLVPNVALNGMFRGVILHLLEKGAHASFFRNPVSSVVVDDYREHVPADKEMYFNKMLARTEAHQYADVASFRADLQLLYENAAAYNSRNGGKHAYEPVIHWAADLLAAADEELWKRVQTLAEGTQDHLQASPPHDAQPDAATLGVVATESIAAPAETGVATAEGELLEEGCQGLANGSSGEESGGNKQQPPGQHALLMLLKKDPHPETQDNGHIRDQDQQQSLGKQDNQKLPVPGAQLPVSAAVQSSSHPAHASTGQQPSSPSCGSGDGSRAGLEALLAACELAAEQDSAPRGNGATIAATAAAIAPAPERRSYPGCAHAVQQTQQDRSQGGDATQDGASLWLSRQHRQDEDPAGSSEGGGMAVCAGGSGGGGTGATGMELVMSTAQAGGGTGSNGGGGGNTGPGGSYLASNAFKNRRHKSKQVYIKPNKVVYLPTTFVEEEFDVAALPMDCELRVEADGVLMDESFRVTIKAVPRQGLSTMYCMTNVMRFQQQYLNWQIYNWTRIDNKHIKIHLQSPSPSQTQLQRNDLDRAASMPEQQVGRNCTRGSEDGSIGFGMAWGQGPRGPAAPSSSLKRKSDTGRYNVTRVERRLAPEPCRDLPAELRLSGTNYLQYPSPIPESPPESPQRRISACLPPRAPTHGVPANGYRHSQIQIHHPGTHYQGPQQVFQQQHSGLTPSFPLPLQQTQRGSNSSITTKHETCSEDSSGPVAVAEAALPLPLTWNPAGGAAHQARLQRPGGVIGVRGGVSTPLFAGAGLQTVDVTQQVHELAERLQLQAQAQGAELNSLVALQLAMATLQQQPFMAQPSYNGGDGVATLDLSSTVDQELVLQQLALGAGMLPHSQPHAHHRGHRGSGGVGYAELRSASVRRPSADGAADIGREPGMSMASAPAHGASFAPQAPSHPGTGELFTQQAAVAHPVEHQRRSSHGDRSRSAQQQIDRVMADAGGPSVSHELEPRSAGAASDSNEGDDVHHIVCHPRRSGSGNGPIGGAGRIFSVAPAGGRILLEVGGVAGGAAGPRISGTGSGTGGRRTSAGVPQQPGIGLAGLPSGLDLSDCALSYLSPSKRFKIAVSTDNAAAATAAVATGELSVLDMLNLKAAAGALSMPPEAALAAALRQGAGGSSAAGFPQATALGGRPFLTISPEMVGQLMS